MSTIRLSISGMSCAGCVSSVESALNNFAGVTSARVNFVEHTATVEGSVDVKALIDRVKSVGYAAAELKGADDEAEKQAEEAIYYRNLLKKSLAAALVGVPQMILAMSGVLPGLEDEAGRQVWLLIGLVTLLVMIYSGGHFFSGAWKSARNHTANMDTLIALGTGTAWIYSMTIVAVPGWIPNMAQHAYFEAAAIILAFINLGSALEMRARGKTSEAIKRLIGLQPKTACVIRNGIELEVAIDEVGLDETLKVRPGERIAVDGVIIEGQSRVDESMISGEPMPVQKQQGDEVVAGTINKLGSFIFQAKRIGEDTALSKIIEMVRNAQGSRPALGRIVDKVSAVFVPAVLLVAVMSFLAWFNFGPRDQALTLAIVTTMTVLIISCPCALGLATPISVMVGIGKAAEAGILIRNGEALQKAGRLTTVMLDKTGTVTEGRPGVTDVVTLNGWSRQTLLRWAASVEQGSEHPLADAVVNAAKEQQLNLLKVEQFKAIAGHGVEAKLNGHTVMLGNRKLMQDNAVELSELQQTAAEFAQKAETAMYIAVDRKLVGLISVADAVKPDSAAAVRRLHQLGIKVVMMTGDSLSTAAAVAAQVGIDQVIADVLPEDKAKRVADLQQQGEQVAMVGDGINDAPALARSDVGYAIGTGTDVAIESADITLMRGSLHGVVDAIHISKATVRNIKQNLFGAFVYNSLGIPIAAGVLYPLLGMLLNPMIAGAAMAMSSLTVVANANRLRLFRSEEV